MGKLHIAFSGGRTSALMTRMLLENVRDKYEDIKVVFANTGQEDERTLEFVNRCDKEYKFNTVWVEANVLDNRKGIGTSFKIVDFETASRKGEPYEAVIAKYGIPNQTWQICSRELKTNTVRAYLRSLGWKRKDYHSAIGIRSDEVHRVSARMEADRVIYPLIEWWPTTKADVIAFWKRNTFDLILPEHRGNCTWCWKKSKRKLLTLAQESPEIFDFPARMEKLYGHVGFEENNRVFFRGRQSTQELLEEARTTEINAFIDPNYLDTPGSCSESCEPFTAKG